MRWILLILSIGALACAGLGLIGSGLGWVIGGNAAGDWLPLGGFLCLVAAGFGTRVAVRAKPPVWPAVLFGLTILGILSECTAGAIPIMWAIGNVDLFPKPPLPPDQQAAAMRFSIVPLVVLPLAVLLFTLLNWQKLSALGQPSATATAPSSEPPPNAG